MEVFKGGSLVLWPLKVIIEVPEGWGILFPGSLIAHSLTPIEGVRCSVDYFSHKSLFDWFGNVLKESPQFRYKKKITKERNAYGTKKTMRKQKTADRVQKVRKANRGGYTAKKGKQARSMQKGRCEN